MIIFFEHYLFPCAYKSIFGIDCPICGFQRALILLTEGHLKESIKMYPPLLLVLSLILFFIIHIANKRILMKEFLLKYSLVVLILVMINYFIKQLIFIG